MTDEKLTSKLQDFAVSPIISLYEIDATGIGGEYLRFCATTTEDDLSVPDIVSYNGNIYPPIDVQVEGFETNASGALPTPILRVSNAKRVFVASIITLKDLVGAKFYRIRTFREHLDDGNDPDPDAHFAIDHFIIERKTAHTKKFIEWELSASIDQQGRKLPGRQILKDSCRFIYRRFDPDTGTFNYDKATCPYTGLACFNDKGQSTPSINDKCGKKLSDCKLRFGENAELPFGGFPGVSRIRNY